MFVVVIHDIRDSDKFWSVAESAQLPTGVTLHNTYPNSDGTRAVCLWEADSVQMVRDVVDGAVGDVSSNDFFEVGPNAQGLPRQ